MIYRVLLVARYLGRKLPLRLCYAMATLFSDVAWAGLSVQRNNAIDNMARVLGRQRDDPEVWQKARTAFRNYGLYMVDFLRLPFTDASELSARFRFSEWEQIDLALAAGKGVVFVSAHVGNWDFSAAALASRGYPVSVVAESFTPKRLNDLVQSHRERHGVKIIPLESPARGVLGALRRNEVLGLLIDRPSPEAGVLVRFFGGLTEVPAGAALLALKTGARVIAGVTIRNADHTYTGFVASHFDVELSGDLSTDVRLLSQRIIDSMESFIRQYPEQWFIFRPMWPQDVVGDAVLEGVP